MVVVMQPYSHEAVRFFYIIEYIIVETFVSETTVEALDIGVLNRLARPDNLESNGMVIGPFIQELASELRSVFHRYSLRIPSFQSDAVQHRGPYVLLEVMCPSQ